MFNCVRTTRKRSMLYFVLFYYFFLSPSLSRWPFHCIWLVSYIAVSGRMERIDITNRIKSRLIGRTSGSCNSRKHCTSEKFGGHATGKTSFLHNVYAKYFPPIVFGYRIYKTVNLFASLGEPRPPKTKFVPVELLMS